MNSTYYEFINFYFAPKNLVLWAMILYLYMYVNYLMLLSFLTTS